MSEEISSLSKKIGDLEKRIDSLAKYLKSALEYLSTDPHSSLTKCRIVLEKLLTNIYIREMYKEPKKGMIGNVLFDKEFKEKIPPRIFARMNFVRQIANLGPHDGDVEIVDVLDVLQNTVLLTEWYISNYDKPDIKITGKEKSIDLLSELKAIYSDYLYPNIKSVKLRHIRDIPGKYILEIRTAKYSYDSVDEIINITDLGFVLGVDKWGDLFFNPTISDAENAKNFIDYFDEISIINCTDLFTEDASIKIYEYWEKFGVTPSGK